MENPAVASQPLRDLDRLDSYRQNPQAGSVNRPTYAAAVSFDSSMVPLNFGGSSSMPKFSE